MKLQKKLGIWLLSQQHRWPLWLPVWFGAGIALYFSLPAEPPNRLLFLTPVLLGLLPFIRRRGYTQTWAFLVLVMLAAGFNLAQIHTHQLATPMLKDEVEPIRIRGQLREISVLEKGARLTLDSVSALEPISQPLPPRIRVKLRGPAPPILSGDWVELRVGLLPPTGPLLPRGFDFARYFYFQGIGAVGYALPPVVRIDHELETTEAILPTFWVIVSNFRQNFSAYIRKQLAGDAGAIAAALVVGDQAGISEPVQDQMRTANLSHILSISGMHMVLVSGLVFFCIRFVLVALPATRHGRYNKQFAALVALLLSGGYLLISGLPDPAVRSYVMVVMVLVAILIHREVLPMRSLALAAMVILIWKPSSVLDPSFQLSFAATMLLIAWFESYARTHQHREAPLWQRPFLYLWGIVITTLVAEAATLPLILSQFNTLPVYGLVANLVVIPVVSFVVMPALILASLLLPFGVDGPFFTLAGYGLHFMIWAADEISQLPHAQLHIHSLPLGGFALLVIGGLWLGLWQGRVRWCGVILAVAGLSTVMLVDLPDIFVTRDGKQIALKHGEQYYLLRGRKQSFAAELWAHGVGQAELLYAKKEAWVKPCAGVTCATLKDGRTLAFSAKKDEVMEGSCVAADIVISGKPPITPCDAKAVVISVDEVGSNSAQWMWLDSMKQNQETRSRPWEN